MSTPDQPAPPETQAEPPGPDWTEQDIDALSASAFWFSMHAPRELLEQYKGMHVAILGERIVDADRDKDALFRRLDADPEAFPPNRVLPRYVPTDEEALRFRY